jgi:glutathione synthase/RimK-type ligase-like ATP-grasp enzyme
MILIITHKEDYTSDFLIDKLNNKGIKYKRLNCEDIYKTSYSIDNNLNFIFDNERSFKSVWFRRTKLPPFENAKFEDRIYLQNEYETLLKNLLSVMDTKWLSEPGAIYRAENKLLQLKLARKIGFNTPKTLVTNSKIELKKFYEENNQDIIIKPLGISRIFKDDSLSFLFTNSVKKEHIDAIENFDLTPCLFQNRIEKELELRITVVGENIFSAGVDSQSNIKTQLDWRKSQLQFFQYKIPKDISDKCIEMVKKLNLKFGAIDLIKDKNGNYIFLEINPNGQWAWIETQTQLPISDAIINELI